MPTEHGLSPSQTVGPYLGISLLELITPDVVDPSDPRAVRVNGTLPEDHLSHVAAFTYSSDMTLLGATLVPHGLYIGSPGMQAASLDHSIWFHRPFRADEWWLYDQVTPSASGGRGLAIARVFSQDGRLVASVAQEGLIRVHETD